MINKIINTKLGIKVLEKFFEFEYDLDKLHTFFQSEK